ncbi:MAG: hypothetical protein KC586_21720, partial [Myxococcales bacterium]|nr:hypothetical protein [Myxococcales bacterium]
KVQRGEGDLATAVNSDAGGKNLAPGGTGGDKRAEPKAAPKPEESAPKSREDEKARRREEADRRKELNKKLRPLQRRSEDLEKTVARLEKEQAERETQMSDPATYGDPKKQSELTQAYSRAKVELEVAMDTWAEVQEEIERLESES